MRIHRPLTPEEAYGIRKECRASSYLLGGTYVLSIGHEREDLIDLNGFITSGISEEGDSIIIGAKPIAFPILPFLAINLSFDSFLLS